MTAIGTPPATACGWWGDGETNREDLATIPTHDGKPLPQVLNLKTAKLPGRLGYGIAVPEPGRAVPYLQATFGRPLVNIGDLKAYGFKTVIDLGASGPVADRHKAKSEAVGMVYHSIKLENDLPSMDQTKLFSELVLKSAEDALLVYAPTSALLGMMWASHRLNMGSSIEFAISEGRLLGLTGEQEGVLRLRARHLKD